MNLTAAYCCCCAGAASDMRTSCSERFRPDGELREWAQVEKIFREWCLPRVYTINRVEGLYLRAQGLHDGVLGFPGAGSAM